MMQKRTDFAENLTQRQITALPHLLRRQEMSYHGSQTSMFRKEYHMRNADRARNVMGMYSMLGVREPRAPFKGEPEVFQRSSLTGAHPGGTIEIQKVIMARRMGISRTRERAAPTPSTTGVRGV